MPDRREGNNIRVLAGQRVADSSNSIEENDMFFRCFVNVRLPWSCRKKWGIESRSSVVYL
jgi:hypothetical protein